RELLAELDAPLIERIDVPDDALGEHLVLVEGEELAQRSRIEPGKENHGARPIAGMHLVWNQALDLHSRQLLRLEISTHLLGALPERKRLCLGKAIGERKILLILIVAGGVHRREEIERDTRGTLM